VNLNLIYDWLIEKTFWVMVLGITLAFSFLTYDTATIKNTIFQIGATIIIFTWLIKKLRFSTDGLEKIVFSYSKTYLKLTIPILIYFLYTFLLFMHSKYKITILEQTMLKFLSLGLFLVSLDYFSSFKKLRKLFTVLIVTMAISLSYALLQYFGLDFPLWKRAYGNRIFSTFANPNFFASFLVLTFPILLSYFLYLSKVAKLKNYSFAPKIIFSKVLLLTLIFTSLFCLFLTRSKGGFIALTVSLSVYSFLFYSSSNRNFSRIIKLTLTLWILIVIIGIIKISYQTPASLQYRMLIWGSALKMIAKKPLFGWGIGGFKIFCPLFLPSNLFSLPIHREIHHIQILHAENEFLEILVEGGFIYFLLFIWIIVTIFKVGLRKLFCKKELPQDYFLIGLYSSIVGILTHNLVGVNLRYVTTSFFFWLFLGLICATIIKNKKDDKQF
jgi:O-antigen ligase